MEPTSGAVPIDPAHSQSWIEVAQAARIYSYMLKQTPTPIEGSNFHQVDSLIPEGLPSLWCRGYLTAALEHLNHWADYAAPFRFHEEQVVVHTLRPTQALARAAAESAAQAVWVMSASSPIGCARRQMTLQLGDLNEHKKASSGDEQAELAAFFKTTANQLKSSGQNQDILNPPTYLTLIREASESARRDGNREDFPKDANEAERIWRTAAGGMHGKRWISMKHNVSAVDTQGNNVLVPDQEEITKVLNLASGIVCSGVMRYIDFCGFASEIPQLLADGFTDLAIKVTVKDGGEIDVAKWSAVEGVED